MESTSVAITKHRSIGYNRPQFIKSVVFRKPKQLPTSYHNINQEEPSHPTANFERHFRQKSIRKSQQLEVTLKATIRNMRTKSRRTDVSAMRVQLPVYTLEQIRELRLPLHEALILNLGEGGFPQTAGLIKSFIDYQDFTRKFANSGSVLLVLPQLKFTKKELLQLAEGLKISELNHAKQLYSKECENMLQLAIDFAFGPSEWWWVGEHLLVEVINRSSNYAPKIGHACEALSRYAYGKHLLENLKEYEQALSQFNITRELSINKMWTIKRYFLDAQGTLFMQSNLGIFECLMKEVKMEMTRNVTNAIIVVDQARRRAVEACFKQGEARALMIKGICEMMNNRAKSAINSFLRALRLQQIIGSIIGICKVRIHLAKAYLMDDCANSSLSILMDLKKDAEEHNLPYYLGQAYKNIGEYYLKIGDPNKATPLLIQAIEIYKQCESTNVEVNNARTLRAISCGLQLFPKYADVLIKAEKSGPGGKKHLHILVDWKNERKGFWTESDRRISYYSYEDIILESRKKVESRSLVALDERLRSISSKSMINISSRSLPDLSQQEDDSKPSLQQAVFAKAEFSDDDFSTFRSNNSN